MWWVKDGLGAVGRTLRLSETGGEKSPIEVTENEYFVVLERFSCSESRL